MGTDIYLLDKEHLPIHPDFEDNQVVMNENEPSSAHAQAKKEKAKMEKAAKMPTQEEASEYFLKNKQEQLSYLHIQFIEFLLHDSFQALLVSSQGGQSFLYP